MANEFRTINSEDLSEFLKKCPFTVIHLDAIWDGYRGVVEKKIDLLIEKTLDTSFGYIDIDDNQEYARSIDLRNVPACSYYKETELIATVIGMQQDIEENLQILREGGTPDTSNKISRK